MAVIEVRLVIKMDTYLVRRLRLVNAIIEVTLVRLIMELKLMVVSEVRLVRWVMVIR